MTAQTEERFRVMQYNVENLFDCRDDSLTDDSDFLPEGSHRWSTYRYWTKLNAVAKVIAGAGEGHLPELVSLCEVENDSVLFSLTRRSALRTAGYQYCMTESPDARGVDVALLYQPMRFRLLGQESLRVQSFRTRDILHVTGRIPTGDTLDVFVVHAPSRRGGKKDSDERRRVVARLLNAAFDSLQVCRRTLNLLVMGDFNDTPGDKTFKMLSARLVLLSADFQKKAKADSRLQPGTYRYQGRWQTLDHVLVSCRTDGSGGLSGSVTLEGGNWFKRVECFPWSAPWLLEEDTKYGGWKPRRTYLGPRYLGGVSDHLPVVADFVL